MSYRTHDVAAAIGVTYRMLDHWIHRGYIPTVSQGTGIPRQISMGTAIRAARVAALVRAGLDPPAAARIARDGAPPGPVTITLDTDAITADLTRRLGS